MAYTNKIIFSSLMLVCCSFFLLIAPVHAFTANSLDIVVSENGDATATFSFTLQGFVENALPQSVLEEKLIGGLATSSDPPVLKSMDRSSAVLLMKKFADKTDVPTGTSYLTATMDFKKAEIALENSGLSSVVSADFSPDKIIVTFPDSYKKEYSNADVLPAISHIIEDPVKIARLQAEAQARAEEQAQVSPATTGTVTTVTPASITTSSGKGSIYVSSTPSNVKVYLDSRYLGEGPAIFQALASGTQCIEITKAGLTSGKKDVTVIPGKTTNVIVALTYGQGSTTEDTAGFPWMPVFVVIIGLVVIAIGGYYYWSEKKRVDWGRQKPTAGATENREPRKDIVIKDTELPKPDIRQAAVSDSTAHEPVAGDTVTSETTLHEPETVNPVISDAPAARLKTRKTVVKDTPHHEPDAGTPVVSDTPAARPKTKKTVVSNATPPEPEAGNSIVRVTMLGDIPDQKTEDNTTKESNE